jgi:hypothetical protein
MNHKKSQKIHFRNRWKERTGNILTDDQYQDLLNMVKRDGVLLYRSKDGGNGSVFRLKYGGAYLKIVYDPFSHTLISLLP